MDTYEELDWVNKGVLTRNVCNQKDSGICWATNTAEAVEAVLQVKGLLLTNDARLSVQQLIDCCKCDGGVNGGDPVKGLEYVKEIGLCRASRYPLDHGRENVCKCCESYNPADSRYSHPPLKPVVKIGKVKKLRRVSERKLMSKVKKRPLILMVEHGIDFFHFSEKRVVQSGGISERGKGGFHHCMLLMGYGYDMKTRQRFWRLRNSYGTGWGDNGNMRLDRRQTYLIRGACYPKDPYFVVE